MDEPDTSEAWSSVSGDLIHRPTSAPPVMELAQQINTETSRQAAFAGIDPAFFGVPSDPTGRDGVFYMEPSPQQTHNALYLNSNGSQEEYLQGVHAPGDGRTGPSLPSNGFPAPGSHVGAINSSPYPMNAGHAHMGPFSMHQGNQGMLGMPYMGNGHVGAPGPHPGTMGQAYGYPSYITGPTAQHSHMAQAEMMYRGAAPGGYFAYPHYQAPPDAHMYGYGNGAMSTMPVRALSVGGDAAIGGSGPMNMKPGMSIGGGYNSNGMGRQPQQLFGNNIPLSESPPGEASGWNKSSPRGKRGKNGKSPHASEPSLSSSTEDLLSLAGKPHLIKEFGAPGGPSGSLEFSGSMTDLPMLPGGSVSPRSPQHQRKHIKVQQRTVGGANAKSMVTSNGVNGERSISQPMPIGWGHNHSGGDDFSGLLGGVHIGNGSGGASAAAVASMGGLHSHQEFVMGSGSPILARMHHPSAAPGSGASGAPGSSSAGAGGAGGAQPICHYYTLGMCGKGDKCRYAHVDEPGSDGGSGSGSSNGVSANSSAASNGGSGAGGSSSSRSGRRTPRAPAGPSSNASPSPIGFNDSSNAAQQQAVVIQQQQGQSPLILNGSGAFQAYQITPTSSIGQQPLLPSASGTLSPMMAGSGGSSGNMTANSAGAQAGNLSLSAPSRYANITLDECVGQIFQMCKDQYGCRFLQKKLDEDKTSLTCDMIFAEILSEIVELMSDPFGNYLCQKLIEKCTPMQRLAIVRGVSGSLVQISKNMHGTRAVQKTIEQLGSPEEIRLIRDALKGSVVALIQDLNGNHVIQKCIHRLEPNDNQFIYDAVAHHCVQVATHRHGCCVMQRCIDHSSNQQKMQLVEEIKNNALSLVQDQFGNYVVQYVLDLGMELVCEALATNLLGHLYFLSTQKFSSNVVEKCLKVGNAATVQMMSKELAEFQTDPLHPVFPQTPNDDPLICLLQHPFGNYVVQTALQVAQIKAPKEWNQIAARIKPLIPNLRSNTYVKRVQGLLSQSSGNKPSIAGGSPSVATGNLSPEGTAPGSPTSISADATVADVDAFQIQQTHQQNGSNTNQHYHHHHNQHYHHHGGSRSHGGSMNRSQGSRHTNKDHGRSQENGSQTQQPQGHRNGTRHHHR